MLDNKISHCRVWLLRLAVTRWCRLNGIIREITQAHDTIVRMKDVMEEALEQAQRELVRSLSGFHCCCLYQGFPLLSLSSEPHVLAFCGRYGSFGSVL